MTLLLDASRDFGVKQADTVGSVQIWLVPENEQSHEPLGYVRACTKDGTPLNNPDGSPLMTRACTIHWTAATYGVAYNSYHAVSCYNPATQESVVVKCLGWDQKGQHAYKRNTGYHGFSLAAMKDAVAGPNNTIKYPGKYPAADPQIISLGTLIGEACAWHHIDPRGYHLGPEYVLQGGQLVATGGHVVIPNLHDHLYLAQLDYPGERWDTAEITHRVVAQACGVYDQLKAGTRQFFYKGLL